MASSEPERSARLFSPKMRLLLTKLCVPLGHPNSVPRARLLARLDQGAPAVLTLISAPAGFGKTTLLADWIHSRGVRAAWLSLDAGDNDAVRFWTYVVTALNSSYPGVGETTLPLLQARPRPPLEAIVAELINALAALSEPVVLALDDCHVVETAAIHKTLAFLIENCPAHFRLILTSRQEPPFPLARLRARRQLVELRAADLRFTPEEVAALLNQTAKLGLSDADIALLQARTEGWAAGLQLAALSLQTENDATAFIHSFGGSHRYVFDYLAQEILRRQPAAVRAFLLRTEMLDRLSGPLCDAVTGLADGITTLARLEQANLFIMPLDQERRWYRYHQLFAEFLRSTLAEEVSPAEVADLHRRAGRWFAQHGLAQEAVAHLFAADEDEEAAQLIETHVAALIDHAELDIVSAWSHALPTALLERRPKLSLGLAWALVATQQVPEAERCIAAVERGLGISTDALFDTVRADLPESLRGPLVEAAMLRSVIAVNAFDAARGLAIARAALPYLVASEQSFLFNGPLQLRPVALFTIAQAHELNGEVTAASSAFAEAATLAYEQHNVHLFPMALSHLAQLQLVRGKLHAAAQSYRQALQVAKGMSEQLSPLTATAYVGLGNLLYEWNDLDGARQHLEDGIALGRKWHNLESLIPGFIGLARFRRAQGDWTGAYAAIDEVAALARTINVPPARTAIAAVRAAFTVAQGDLETAARWAATSGLTTNETPHYLRETEAIVFARVLLAQGQIAEAHELLRRLAAAAASASRTARTIEILVLQALAYDAQGEEDLALDTFQHALALALAHQPPLILLDEPTAGLDVASRTELHTLMQEYRERGTAIVLATHDMAEAEKMADRVAILLRGKVVADGSPRELTTTGAAFTKVSVRTEQAILSQNGVVFPAVRQQALQDDYAIYYSTDPGPTVAAILDFVTARGDRLIDLRVERPSLEERFLEITNYEVR